MPPPHLSSSHSENYPKFLDQALREHAEVRGEREDAWYAKWKSAPDSPVGLISAAHLADWLGKREATYFFLGRALQVDPKFAPAHARLGLLHAKENNWTEAIRCFAKALDSTPNNEVYLANLGVSLFKAGENDDAMKTLQMAWEHDRQSNCLASNLSCVAIDEGELALAKDVAKAALEHPLRTLSAELLNETGGDLSLMRLPSNTWPIYALAIIATISREYDEAQRLYEQLLDIDAVTANIGLGSLSLAKGNFKEAYAAFSKAIDSSSGPNVASALFKRALSSIPLGKHDEALRSLNQVLDINPNFTGARLERAALMLRQGNFEEGWADYEARRDSDLMTRLNHFDAAAEWAGEPLAGKTIIIVSEQGQGDIIQFMRFAKNLSDMGGDVVVFTVPSLTRLIEIMPGVESTFTFGDDIPAYDYWIPVASLPLRLGINREANFWTGPYVSVPDQAISIWADHFTQVTSPKIGLVWSGGDYRNQKGDTVYRRRNLSLKHFLPLLEIPEISFFSLQKGRARDELDASSAREQIVDHSNAWRDFIDTAGFIAHLDLVITVDTSVAHLAGAMGKPVWILSRTGGCWRWMDNREDSPWYPSAKIFRQEIGESWEAVIKRVKIALAIFKNELSTRRQ